jgi:heptosyltransferase II
MNNEIRFKLWRGRTVPKSILVIRYQAIGDVVITLPYLNDLKKQLPNTRLHLITTIEASSIPLSLPFFDKVIVIAGGKNAKLQFLLTLCKLPQLLWERYSVVMDLQNNRVSGVIRKILRPLAWCEFDRLSSKSAAERTRLTIESIGLGSIKINYTFDQRIDEQKIRSKLVRNGWKEGCALIVLNPAGAFETRHWPVANYVQLSRLIKRNNPLTQFLVIGLKAKLHLAKEQFRLALKDDLIDLTGQTSAAEAFAVLRRVKLIITEDSGLMHMSWVQGVPTLALFGSTRSDWSAPKGERSICLNSSDLACGNCLLEECAYGDNHCLTRYSPEFVFERITSFLRY